MLRARRILFWTHLVMGLAAGGVIAITVFTGACLAVEKPVLAWAERDLRRVAPPAVDSPRLALETLVAKVREAAPKAPLSELTIHDDPRAAVVLVVGRTNRFFGNPFTGEVRAAGPSAWRDFFQCMLRWHRWLGVAAAPRSENTAERERERASRGDAESAGQSPSRSEGEPRRGESPGGAHALARTVVGISAGLFGLLCVSGLCLWWPRSWRWKTLRAGLTPNLRLRGRARDWNWHQTVGFWSAPLLLVMSLTGLVMAFRPVGNVLYGPATAGGAGAAGSGANTPTFTAPEPGARALGPERLVAIAQGEVSGWEEITVRTGGRPRGGGQGNPGGGEGRRGDGREGSSPRGIPAVIVTVREAWSLPLEAIQLQLQPFTGDVLRRTTFATQVSELGWRRAMRGLNRTLHTGEAGGWLGQALAFGACLGGLLLVGTGFALSARRFFRRHSPVPTAAVVGAEAPSSADTTPVPSGPAPWRE